jgi:hypothetical protein
MTSVMVAGLGDVGVRTARQLLDTPGVEQVFVAARTRQRADTVASALHDGATPWSLDDTAGPLPPGVIAVVSTLPADDDIALARAAVAAGAGYATCTDDSGALGALLALDGDARAAQVHVVIGCGLAPGLSDVLARHAADALDTVDEIHVARWGVAGDDCVASARRAHRDPGLEWRDNAYVHDRAQGAQLVWFPDPVGARECELVATGVELLVAAHAGVDHVTARLGAPPHRLGRSRLVPARRDRTGEWGAVRTEVWGQRDGARAALVYGVIERTAVAAGTMLGVAGGWLAGVLPQVASAPPGAFGLGAAVAAPPFLAELARRGVKAAVFEGAAVA